MDAFTRLLPARSVSLHAALHLALSLHGTLLGRLFACVSSRLHVSSGLHQVPIWSMGMRQGCQHVARAGCAKESCSTGHVLAAIRVESPFGYACAVQYEL